MQPVLANPLDSALRSSRAALEMRNGDVLQGVIASRDAGAVTLNSDYGPVRIPLAAVTKVNSCAIHRSHHLPEHRGYVHRRPLRELKLAE